MSFHSNTNPNPIPSHSQFHQQQQSPSHLQQQHDLSFQIENGDGTVTGPSSPSSVTNSTLEFVQKQLQQSSHPMVIIFHILFKAASLVIYIFGGWFLNYGPDRGARFIAITVICILLLAADFWVVKNVTGRLLVGLRWWNQVEEDGTKWIFESSEGKRPVNAFDQRVFWTVLYGTPFIWSILFIIGFISFKFNWLLIVGMALVLSGANVYGYYKCSNEQKIKTQQMMQQYATQGAMAVMRTNMVSLVTTAIAGVAGTGTGTAGPNQGHTPVPTNNPNFV